MIPDTSYVGSIHVPKNPFRVLFVAYLGVLAGLKFYRDGDRLDIYDGMPSSNA